MFPKTATAATEDTQAAEKGDIQLFPSTDESREVI
jgi:hypothetical protein